MSEGDFDLAEWIHPDLLKSPSPQPAALHAKDLPPSHESSEPSTAQLIDRPSSQESSALSTHIQPSPTDTEQSSEGAPNVSSDSSASTLLGERDGPGAFKKHRESY